MPRSELQEQEAAAAVGRQRDPPQREAAYRAPKRRISRCRQWVRLGSHGQSAMSSLAQKRTCQYRRYGPTGGIGLRLPGRADLRRAHRLGHPEEDRDTLSAAAG